MDTAYDGDTGQAMAETGVYDLIILDRMLPRKEGVTLLKELLARLRAVLRRSRASVKRAADDPVIAVGGLALDTGAYSCTLDGAPLVLTRQEFDLLASLARSAGRVKTREQLLLEVAERDFEVFDRSIDVHISSLRKKLNDDPKEPRFIETIRGVGYRLKRPGADT